MGVFIVVSGCDKTSISPIRAPGPEPPQLRLYGTLLEINELDKLPSPPDQGRFGKLSELKVNQELIDCEKVNPKEITIKSFLRIDGNYDLETGNKYLFTFNRSNENDNWRLILVNENLEDCPKSRIPPKSVCGNGICESGEDCPEDCVKVEEDIPLDEGPTETFGSCKSLVYKGDINEKINFVFIPPIEIQSEDVLKEYLMSFFDENKPYSFYSIRPYDTHKEDFNFYYLNEYSGENNIRTVKKKLKEKCPKISENIHQIIGLQDIGGTKHDYFGTTQKVGHETIGYKAEGERLVALHTFLHEVGHSLGGLDEGYAKSFLSHGEIPASYYKENYNDNSKLPSNWDIEGCPKWCSGQINTNSICYEDYSIYKECVLSTQTQTSQEAEECANVFNNALVNKGVEIFPHDCNFGVGCIEDTNCWIIGMPFFRAYARDIMYSGSDSISFVEGVFEPSYGPTGEQHIKETIELLKQWNHQKNNLEYVNFEVADSYINNFDDRDEVHIEFRLLDSENNVLSIFEDDILDNIFSVKYKKSSESNYFNLPSINKYLNGNYYITFTNFRSEKELPLDQLDFIFEIKLPKFENSWNYVLRSD